MPLKLPRNKGFFHYYEELVGTWTRRLKSRHQAEDLAHDTFVRLLETTPCDVQQPRAYLHRTARNIAMDNWRRAERHQGAIEHLSAPMPQQGPEADLHAVQLAEGIERALAELPLKCRQVFVWQKLEGLSHAEIAERLGLSRNMVERYMIRAMRHLLDRMEPRP